MEKQVVKYSSLLFCQVGTGAMVVPVNHPDTYRVSNGFTAYTSEVLSYNSDTGEFETKNSRYVPQSVVQ